MKILVAATTLAVATTAGAASPYTAPGLPSTELVRPLLEKDPAVAAARAGIEAAEHEARALSASPYEWTPRVTGQRRRLDSGLRYNEWNVGIERGLRLPAKADADRRIGGFIVEAARARYGEALHETALEFMNRWIDWQGAEQALALSERNLESTRKAMEAVARRVRAGDASRLEEGLARAELSEQARLNAEARAAATNAWLRLSSRFAGAPRRVEALPLPTPPDRDAAFWRQRVLEESDEIKMAVALEQRARARAERLRAERIPDPTVSAFTASEFGGAERFSGIGVSIPLPGGARSARADQALSEGAVSAQEVTLKKLEVEERVMVAFASAQGATEVLRLAREGAAAMSENARLAQRAYELGEGDLSSLLLARRQAVAAEVNATQAQVAALKASYALLIHAHFIWDLDHE